MHLQAPIPDFGGSCYKVASIKRHPHLMLGSLHTLQNCRLEVLLLALWKERGDLRDLAPQVQVIWGHEGLIAGDSGLVVHQLVTFPENAIFWNVGQGHHTLQSSNASSLWLEPFVRLLRGMSNRYTPCWQGTWLLKIYETIFKTD